MIHIRSIVLNIVLLLLIITWLISGVGLVVMIMLHSGKGTGVGDILAASFNNSMTGTSIVEKNLDRITVILAIIFFATIFAMMVVYPHN